MKTMILFDNERTLSRRKVNTLETTKPPHFCEGFVLYSAAPDERYVSARVGFSGIWSSLENSAYPN